MYELKSPPYIHVNLYVSPPHGSQPWLSSGRGRVWAPHVEDVVGLRAPASVYTAEAARAWRGRPVAAPSWQLVEPDAGRPRSNPLRGLLAFPLLCLGVLVLGGARPDDGNRLFEVMDVA